MFQVGYPRQKKTPEVPTRLAAIPGRVTWRLIEIDFYRHVRPVRPSGRLPRQSARERRRSDVLI